MEDVDINRIDYKWVDECNDKNKLKKAIKILKDDGGYYPDLEKHIEEKLKRVDKKFVSQVKPIENITEEERNKYRGDINNWENTVREVDKILLNQNENTIYEEDNHKKISQFEKKKLAENEKIKGNDLMKTKDFNDAIKHYTSSIKLDPIESTTYCNRALAYIKIKQFENGLNDCNKAIQIKSDYTKAFYRRAICLVGMIKFEDAFNDLIFLLSDSPNNNEILDEIKNTKEKWKEFVGKDEYLKHEAMINQRIENANRGSKEARKQTQEPQTKRIKIEESTVNDKKENKNIIPDTKKEFKRVKITEENTEEDNNALEKKFEEFWKVKNEVAKNFEQLYKQEKFNEILEIARVNLSECQNFLPELSSKPTLKSKLENKIAELNSFIQLCSEKLKQPGNNTTINKEAESKEQNEKVKKFYKTPTIAEEKMEKATKIAEEEMSVDEFPKTANGFEKAFSSLKKNSEAFYKFLRSFGPQNLVTIFDKIEMSFDLVAGIINTQKSFGLSDEGSFILALNYFSCISKTKKFNLMKSFLKGAIREEMKLFIQEGRLKFSINEETFSLISEVEKAYF